MVMTPTDGTRKFRRARLLVEKPWEAPRVGDVAQTADGKAYRRIERFTTSLGRPLDEYAIGCHIVYVGQFGERSCYITTWFGGRERWAQLQAAGRHQSALSVLSGLAAQGRDAHLSVLPPALLPGPPGRQGGGAGAAEGSPVRARAGASVSREPTRDG